MATLYENIMTLCDAKGIRGGKMCVEAGVSKSLLTDLKMGRRSGVSAVTAQKIASYFGVSVGYLLGDETDQPSGPADTGADTPVKDNRNLIRIAARDGSYLERQLTDDQLAALTAILDQMPDVPDGL